METNFDGTTFVFLLVPQVFVVALVPFMIYALSARNTSPGARRGIIMLLAMGILVTVLFTFLVQLAVGMNQAPIGPLGARLLHEQPGILLFLVVLAIAAGIVAPGHKIYTLSLWEFVIIAGLVAFWLMEGLAPSELTWPAVLLALALGAGTGFIGGLATTGRRGGPTKLIGTASWVAAGIAGVTVGLAVAWSAGAQSPYTDLLGPPPLSGQLSTLLLVAIAAGTWLGLCTLASGLVGPAAAQRGVLIRGLLGELLLFAVWLVTSFALENLYPAEYTAHLTTPTSYAIPDVPNAIAITDVDADGHADVVIRYVQFSTAEVLPGNGDGTLRLPTACSAACLSIPTYGYRTKAEGDFNGDGRQDKVSIGRTVSYPLRGGTLSVQLDAGDGTMREAGQYRVGSDPHCVVVADLNGDGRADLATANYSSNDATFLLGNGDGTFRPGGSVFVGQYPSSLGVGDLNGDGKPDIVVAAGYNVAVLLGR